MRRRPQRRIPRPSRKSLLRVARESFTVSRLRCANVEEPWDVIAKLGERLGIQRACRLGCARLANLLEPQAGRDGRVDVVGQRPIEARYAESLDVGVVGRMTELPVLDERFAVEIIRDSEFYGAPGIVVDPAHPLGREKWSKTAESGLSAGPQNAPKF